MAKTSVQNLDRNLDDRNLDDRYLNDQYFNNKQGRSLVSELAKQVALVVGGSLLVALCARITIPLPFTPVPLTVQNFGVLLVGLLMGSRRGFAALVLYLFEGAMGMPVFSSIGPGGIAQLLGPTGGFLLAYPLVAWVAGYVMEHGPRSFARAAVGGLLGEVVLFTGGLAWLAVLTHSIAQAVRWGLYWFLFAELIKLMMAAAIASRWHGRSTAQQ
jgi:biotin transport system substrate-specific component